MEQNKEYLAFISYQRKDEAIAKRLQHTLEFYKLPIAVIEKEPALKDGVRPIFVDMTELGDEPFLKPAIENALEGSRFLIVICSPRSALSKWVNKEVEYFIQHERIRRIIPFIIEGSPNAKEDNKKCCPPLLQKLINERELLGININEMGFDAAAVKVVSRMFRVKFSSMWNRYEKEKEEEQRKLKEQNDRLLIAQSRFIAEKAIDIADEDSFLAQHLALTVLPNDLEKPDRPYTPEAERALRFASRTMNAMLFPIGSNAKSAIYSKNGSYIASITQDGRDGCVCVFCVNDRTLMQSFKTPNAGIFCVAFSPDNNYIAAASIRSIFVWRISTGEVYCVLKSQTNNGFINGIAFNPNGNRIVSVSSTGEIEFWKLSSKMLEKKLIAHDAPIYSIAFSPDGSKFVTGSRDKSIKMWDAKTGELIRRLIGHTGWVMQVSYNQDGNYILSASDDTTIRIWDSKTGESLKTFLGHRGGIKTAAFSPDGKTIVSASIWDRSIRFWDVETGMLIKTMDNMNNVQSVEYSPENGRFILLAFQDKRIKIMDSSFTKIDCKTLKETHWRIIGDVCFSPNCKNIAYAFGNRIKIINSEHGSLVHELEGHVKEVESLCFSKDSNRIISSSKDCTVRIWDTETGKLLSKFNNEDGYFDKCVVLCNDGKRFISASGWGCIVKIRDIENGKNIITLKGHNAFVHCVSISSDDKYIVSGSWDQSIIVWDANTGLQIKKLVGHEGSVYTVSFSSDGNMIISASSESIRIWNTRTGELLRKIEGVDSHFNSAYFDPMDNKKIISASTDRTIRIWDVDSGLLMQTIQVHSGSVRNASFCSDGKYIVSASNDGTICICSFTPLQQLINQTNERFKERPLTTEEKKRYYIE